MSLRTDETLTYVATGTIDPGATGSITATAMVDNPRVTPRCREQQRQRHRHPDAGRRSRGGQARTRTCRQRRALVYTLAITNHGPSDATGIRVLDPTPSGLDLVAVAAPCSGGFPCDIPVLSAGATVTFEATFNVPTHLGDEPLINRASVAGAAPDPVTDNNPGNLDGAPRRRSRGRSRGRPRSAALGGRRLHRDLPGPHHQPRSPRCPAGDARSHATRRTDAARGQRSVCRPAALRPRHPQRRGQRMDRHHLRHSRRLRRQPVVQRRRRLGRHRSRTEQRQRRRRAGVG